MQGQRYIEICERNPSQEQFFYGWIANQYQCEVPNFTVHSTQDCTVTSTYSEVVVKVYR